MKGISAFIAMVLTIAFVAGAAIIISGWLTGLTREQTGIVAEETETKTECNYGGIRILDDTVKCSLSTSPDKSFKQRPDSLSTIPIKINSQPFKKLATLGIISRPFAERNLEIVITIFLRFLESARDTILLDITGG